MMRRSRSPKTEFLAHSPASEREIYIGKLIGSILPGYVATLIGFGIYALVVNIMVGPKVGGWFFPTGDWWLLMLWVVPPFIALALSVVLRISARVRSATASATLATQMNSPGSCDSAGPFAMTTSLGE